MILYRWHSWLDMSKKDREWHLQDIADELYELKESTGLINCWSEKSDVVYTVTRARWSGHDVDYPIGRKDQVLGRIYMYPKYTMRFVFFRRAGKKLNSTVQIHQVRNPKKIHKLRHIAEKYNLPPDEFVVICQKQYRYWRFVLPK
jgi:hypothetical protein